MDIDAFKVFKAVVETGSFAKAAERLNKVQSAISYQVQKLENFIGQSLFDRSGYRAELTDTGKIILMEGDKLLEQFSHIENLARLHKSGWEPRLELVIDGILPIQPVLDALSLLEQKSVATSIQLSVEFLSGVQSYFERQQAHIMLVKDYLPSNDLTSIPLPHITAVLVTSCQHPLTRLKKVSKSTLAQFVELLVRDTRQDVQNSTVTGQALFGENKAYFFSDFAQKKQALLTGLGFGWMPSYLISEELMSEQLVLVDFIEGNKQQITPYLVQRKRHPGGKTQRWLADELQTQFNRKL